jgi:hypothetical protein
MFIIYEYQSACEGIGSGPVRRGEGTVRPAFDEMMDFCAGALHHVPWGQSIELAADLRPKAMAQG